jgi:uncharacterized SAM-binding protein YcdF (DUF218 family)
MSAQLDVNKAARTVWDYHNLHHPECDAEAIIVLGSNDPRVANRGAELYLAGRAPLLVISGAVGKLTEGMYGGLSEAAYFGRIAADMGVPASAMLLEERATNTGENIDFSRELILQRLGGRPPASLILVQKPYMERRTLATFLARWPPPVPRVTVTSPAISFDDYPLPDAGLSRELVTSIMLGDLHRIRHYPARGFQVEQPIPEEVADAFDILVVAGYTNHLLSDAPRSVR